MTPSTSSSLFVALAAVLAFGTAAGAHDAGTAVLEVEVDGDRARVTYGLSLQDLAAVAVGPFGLDPNADGMLGPAEAQVAALDLVARLGPALTVRSGSSTLVAVDARAITETPVPLGDERARVGVVLTYRVPGDGLSFGYRPPEGSPLPRRLVVELPGGNPGVLGDGTDEVTWRAEPAGRVAIAFAAEGVVHILSGWDHLAFLLALLIVASGTGSVLRLVTAFTLAHSVTLGLTALNVVSPPSRLVEAIIAASIVYVAVENLGTRELRNRALLVFGFGLVHGMGFGGVLLDLELARPVPALLGFNLGVEVGQLLVVASVLPLLALLKKRQALYDRLVVKGGSLALGALGLFWLVERVGLA